MKKFILRQIRMSRKIIKQSVRTILQKKDLDQVIEITLF